MPRSAIARAQAAPGRPRWIFYVGNRFACPCCGGRFRALRPLPGRQNAQCPRCGSYERHRVLALYLRNQILSNAASLKVLHFAPERFLEKQLTSTRGLQYLTADIEEGRAMMHIDITDIPLPSGSFDLVLCSHVLEHVPDDATAMKELCRMLKPSGRAILQHPIDYGRAKTYEDSTIDSAEARERAFTHPGHVRVYGRDFKQRLEAAGFAVEVLSYPRQVGSATAERYRLQTPWDTVYNGSDLYMCMKQG